MRDREKKVSTAARLPIYVLLATQQSNSVDSGCRESLKTLPPKPQSCFPKRSLFIDIQRFSSGQASNHQSFIMLVEMNFALDPLDQVTLEPVGVSPLDLV